MVNEVRLFGNNCLFYFRFMFFDICFTDVGVEVHDSTVVCQRLY